MDGIADFKTFHFRVCAVIAQMTELQLNTTGSIFYTNSSILYSVGNYSLFSGHNSFIQTKGI